MIWIDITFIMIGKVEIYIFVHNPILEINKTDHISNVHHQFHRHLKMFTIFAVLPIFEYTIPMKGLFVDYHHVQQFLILHYENVYIFQLFLSL